MTAETANWRFKPQATYGWSRSQVTPDSWRCCRWTAPRRVQAQATRSSNWPGESGRHRLKAERVGRLRVRGICRHQVLTFEEWPTCFGSPQTAVRRERPQGTWQSMPHGPAVAHRPGIRRERTRRSARRMFVRSSFILPWQVVSRLEPMFSVCAATITQPRRSRLACAHKPRNARFSASAHCARLAWGRMNHPVQYAVPYR